MTGYVSATLVADSLSMLPPFPGAVNELLDNLDDEDACLETIVASLYRDPLVFSRILGHAPAHDAPAGQSFAREVHAVMARLGQERLRETILIVTLADFMRFLDHEQSFWQHSLAVGAGAQELAGRCGLPTHPSLVAGMLHDIGQAWMYAFYPGKFLQVGETVHRHGRPRHEVERDVFGMDHGEVGGLVAQAWGLPAAVCAAIAGHHAPPGKRVDGLVAVTHLAEAISNGLDLPFRPDNRLAALSEAAIRAVGIDWDRDGEDILGRIDARFRQLASRL